MRALGLVYIKFGIIELEILYARKAHLCTLSCGTRVQ